MTSTTQSSPRSGHETPPPVAAVQTIGVGIAVDEEAPDVEDSAAFCSTEMRALPFMPRVQDQPMQNVVIDETTKKQHGHSLRMVPGEPCPPRRGRDDSESGNDSSDRVRVVYRNATGDPGSGQGVSESSNRGEGRTQPNTNSNGGQRCFGNLTNTQCMLAIALFVIVVLVVTIAVVVTIVLLGGFNSGGGTGGTVSEPPRGVVPSSPPTALEIAPPTDPSRPPSPRPTQSLPNDGIFLPTPLEATLMPTMEPGTTQPTVFLGSKTLEMITARGYLLCGVRTELDGFSKLNGDTYEGFEADLCQAIAAAVFGSAESVQMVPLEEEIVFTALQLGSVDVLATHTTHTMERDVFEPSAEEGFTFSVPYFYDGLTFGGVPPFGECADNLNATGHCSNLTICTIDGSSYSSIVAELIPDARRVLLPSLTSVYEAFDSSPTVCNAIAGATFEVSQQTVRNNGYTGSYEVGAKLYSREPLSLVTRDGDARWSDMVQWVLQALFAAEEQGVSMTNTESFMTTDFFGDSFITLFRDAIAAVGNYGDMYERHLESIVPRTNINMINKGRNSPLMISLPFGNLKTSGRRPIAGGTLQRILDRGELRCGISRAPGFATFDAGTGVWTGLDVDFCRAISAAIFNGAADDVDFRVVPGRERFEQLASGNVDLLSRITTWTLERDVMEATTGMGFSFAQPNYYDGQNVGGQPPHVTCADILDTTSEECLDLKICILSGTTTLTLFRARFAGRFIVPQQTLEEVVAGLTTGACNVIAGGTTEVSETGVRNNGYTGPYEEGQNQFSKEPLAIVTRQDDPQFTAFVNWIVSATFYADEKGITQATAGEMPFTNLFGPVYGRMLIDAIQAVGNFGEIYERNLQAIVPRKGQNSANVNPFGPQHFPLI